MTAARAFQPDPSDREAPRALAIEPSARTLHLTAAADKLRDALDLLKLEHRLTPAEVAVILAGEVMRHSRHELAYERQTGQTSPLSLRYILPDRESPQVDEAMTAADAITSVALSDG